ncbi:SH3 domain-containing protein [Streptomyces cavernicola]|uniref:SH3 domain-containing protein n=1 Tax=Streptomyces cavernicola TaxID=3043613 RepID=A0ABT6S7S5_9ACTN|nr:SH3 domain-containing protein [Streptomyces sp. B-S-A6]MDI3403929.1 SH3 domain-containing protein [Streptomyces sp. B-S-A6]
MGINGVKKALAGFAVTAATVGAVAATTGAAQASAPAAQAAPAAAQEAKARVCTVNDNGVNFRGGPGPEYPVLGKVNRGQNMDLLGTQGNWVHGNLWGGHTGVWIHTAYLDNC